MATDICPDPLSRLIYMIVYSTGLHSRNGFKFSGKVTVNLVFATKKVLKAIRQLLCHCWKGQYLAYLLTYLDVCSNTQQEKFNTFKYPLVTFQARKLTKAIIKQVEASNFVQAKMFSLWP